MVELIKTCFLWVNEHDHASFEDGGIFDGYVNHVPEYAVLRVEEEGIESDEFENWKRVSDERVPFSTHTHHALLRVANTRLMTTPIHINHRPPGSIRFW